MRRHLPRLLLTGALLSPVTLYALGLGEIRLNSALNQPFEAEIELLSPSVNRVMRPDNCEYPWADAAGNLHVPVDWTFAPSSLLEKEAGRLFLKLIRQSLERFT